MQWIKDEWNMIWTAGTIMWSRIKLGLGLLVTAITNSGADISMIISNQKALFAIKVGGALIAMDGAISEAVRRHGATDLAPPPSQ